MVRQFWLLQAWMFLSHSLLELPQKRPDYFCDIFESSADWENIGERTVIQKQAHKSPSNILLIDALSS